MARRVFPFAFILAAVWLAAVLPAQESHPLNGTWHGEWHPGSGPAVKLAMYMKWDGQNVGGTIFWNSSKVPLKVATFQGWNVHFEADAAPNAHISADGKVENVGSYHRTISGTWTQGSATGSFKLTRDD